VKKFWCFLLALTAIAGFSADLVKDGQAAGVIVLSSNPTRSARFAAAELNYHIEKMTGTKLPVMDSPQAGKTNIFVGAGNGTPANDSFDRQEYLIKVSGSSIFLLGRDKEDHRSFDYRKPNTFPGIWEDIGTCYAVYDFLEMFGVRWYLPKEIGLHYAGQKNLSIGEMELRRKPSMEYRHPIWAGYSFNEDLLNDTVGGPVPKTLNQRDAVLFRLRSRIGGRQFSINHSFYSFYKRFPEKKEWFAQGYGNSKPPQMCLSSEGFFRQVVQDAQDYFDGKASPSVAGLLTKGLDCFPVFPMDNGSWCKCGKCQALVLKKATRGAGKFSNNKASNYVFDFVNRVAREVRKSHPGKLIGCGAYHDYCYPPDFKLEPNIRLVVCLHTRDVFSETTVKNDKDILDAWTGSQPHIVKNVWSYFCFPALSGKNQKVRVFPGFFAGKIDRIFREYLAANVRGTFMESSYADHDRIFILMDQLDGYLYWKLAWNRENKGDGIINEFFRNYYGPAEKPMKDMYMLIQERYTNPKYRVKASSIETVSWEYLGTKEVMKQLDGYMAQAKRLAAAEPYKSRVALYEKGIMDYMRKGHKTFVNRALQMSGSMMQADVPFLKVPSPGDPSAVNWKQAGLLKLFGGLRAEPLKEKLEVRVAHDGTYIYFCYLQKCDTSRLVRNQPLWQNDEWESYFARQQSKPYQMFGTDCRGGVEGEYNLETLKGPWNNPGKIIHEVKKDHWKVLMALKLSEIVPGGIKPGEILYYNVIRAAENQARGCWIPTFAGFHAPDRFGELYLMPGK